MTNHTTPLSVEAYLEALKAALAGEPRAVIQDALSDAEEHLRAALQQHPEKSQEAVLAETIAAYGTPEEVAEEYRQLESAQKGPFGETTAAREKQRFGGFFAAVADPRAYGALLYMLLSLATGIFYFTWVVTGLSLSFGLMILIIGVPVALLFLASVRVLAHVEGRIVETLLGVRMPRRLPVKPDTELTFWSRIKAMLSDPRTWTAMLYMVLHLALGIVYFTIAVTGLALAVSLIFGPLTQLLGLGDFFHADGHAELYAMDTFFDNPVVLLLMIPLGVLSLLATLNLAKLIGTLHGRFAEKVLVRL
jgi:uncharacterized membrane protein